MEDIDYPVDYSDEGRGYIKGLTREEEVTITVTELKRRRERT